MRLARRALAGLDAGVTGSLVVVAWFVFHSWARGELWYTKFNVAAGVLFGSRVFQAGASMTTLVGFSLLVVVYSLAAVPAAWAVPQRSSLLLRIAAVLIYSALFHTLLERWAWPHISTYAPSYFPRTATVPAHLLYAICLLRVPARRRLLEDQQIVTSWQEPSGPAR
ncbi:MAG: hypothetical protein IT161_09645 [Bryobacterales bacterium]|nr:hypothetical protein [Bryobacterales bacterium]